MSDMTPGADPALDQRIAELRDQAGNAVREHKHLWDRADSRTVSDAAAEAGQRARELNDQLGAAIKERDAATAEGRRAAARHSCGFFIAQHGRLLPPGVWEHPCEQIRAIRRRELSAPPSWRERVRRLVPRPRVRAAKTTTKRASTGARRTK